METAKSQHCYLIGRVEKVVYVHPKDEDEFAYFPFRINEKTLVPCIVGDEHINEFQELLEESHELMLQGELVSTNLKQFQHPNAIMVQLNVTNMKIIGK